MSTPASRRLSAPVRSFGTPESALEEGNQSSHQEPSAARRILGKFSLSNLRHGRPSFATSRGEGEPLSTPNAERAPIPTMMQPSREVYAAPLPKLSMIVLSIVSHSTFWKYFLGLIFVYSVRRPCLGNSYVLMYRLLSYYLW